MTGMNKLIGFFCLTFIFSNYCYKTVLKKYKTGSDRPNVSSCVAKIPCHQLRVKEIESSNF